MKENRNEITKQLKQMRKDSETYMDGVPTYNTLFKYRIQNLKENELEEVLCNLIKLSCRSRGREVGYMIDAIKIVLDERRKKNNGI